MKVVGTLRFRLTALYLAFFSLLFILFSIFLYSLLGTSLRSRLDETLTSEANTAAVMFQDELQEMKGNTELAASETVAGVRFRGLVASGVSCRQQVIHFTGVQAVHPAMVLRELLDNGEPR